MARTLPTIPDDKLEFYKKKLWREVNNLFTWKGLPPEIPVDYLERALTRKGRVMFFNAPEAYGYMAVECQVRGVNLYQQPVEAWCVTPNDQMKPTQHTRKIMQKYVKDIPVSNACVLINNMYNGESLTEIVEHYANRLSALQMAMDTNIMWQNMPVIFSTTDEAMRLSIEKFFEKIFTGEPWVIVDKTLLRGENEVIGNVTAVPYIIDKLEDAKNEIYNEFKTTIGLKASGADKKERLLVDEVNINEETAETCLNIMLNQRLIFCEEVRNVFGLTVTVTLGAGEEEEKEEQEEEGAEEDGTDDDRT